VYGDDEVPAGLLRAAQRAEGQQLGDAAAATYAALKVADGYDAGQSAWLSELRVPTRLGDEQTTVRLARVEGGRLVPWADAAPAWKAWALSEVRVRRTRVPPDAVRPEFAAAAAAARSAWGRFEQGLPVLPLEEQAPGVWRGSLLRPDRGPVALWYTAGHGLSYDDPTSGAGAVH
jgi:CRISPR-associated endonuclease/helicase Cas3